MQGEKPGQAIKGAWCGAWDRRDGGQGRQQRRRAAGSAAAVAGRENLRQDARRPRATGQAPCKDAR